MANYGMETADLDGLAPTYNTADAATDAFKNNGRVMVELVNSSGANAYTIAFTTPATIKGVAIENPTATLATNGRIVCGPFPPELFNDANSRVAMVYTGSAPATDITFAVIELPL